MQEWPCSPQPEQRLVNRGKPSGPDLDPRTDQTGITFIALFLIDFQADTLSCRRQFFQAAAAHNQSGEDALGRFLEGQAQGFLQLNAVIGIDGNCFGAGCGQGLQQIEGVGLSGQVDRRGRGRLATGHRRPVVVEHHLDPRHMAKDTIAGGVHAAVAFGAVADNAEDLVGHLRPRQNVAGAFGLARPHGDAGVHGIQEIEQGIAADITKDRRHFAAALHGGDGLSKEPVGAAGADHRRPINRGKAGLFCLDTLCGKTETVGYGLRAVFGARAETRLAGYRKAHDRQLVLEIAIAVVDYVDLACDGGVEAANQLFRQGVGEGERQDIDVGAEGLLYLLGKDRVGAAGDDPGLAGALEPFIEGRGLDHRRQADRSLTLDPIVVFPGDTRQRVEAAQIALHDLGLAGLQRIHPHQTFAVAEGAGGKDHHRGLKTPADVDGDTGRFKHLLMVARFEDRHETALEQVTRIDQMLGGTGGEVAGDKIDQSAARFGEERGAGEDVGRLEQTGDLHGHDRIASGQGVAEADAGGDRLVHRPADPDFILNLRQAAVDNLGARRSRIAVGAVDAGADAADGEGDIALQDLGSARFQLTKFVHSVSLHGLSSCLLHLLGLNTP